MLSNSTLDREGKKMLANNSPFGGLRKRNMYSDVSRIELHPEGKRLGCD